MDPQYHQRSQFWGALWIALAITGGAFGAHGLRNILVAEALNWWNTGCHYGVIGGFSLCISSLLLRTGEAASGVERRILSCFQWGTLLFCASLWLLALTEWRKLGLITPVGGSLLIAGWLQVAYEVRQRSTKK